VTLTATFILTNTYFVGSPSQATVKIQDSDEPTNAVVANLNVPVGIDYHFPSNSLIVAINNPTVTSATNATRIAQIGNPTGAGRKLEGVLTLPNDVAKYGPWAGKIVIGGESFGVVFTVDTNGTVTPYNLGLAVPEDVRLIPSGQNLYCLDVTGNQVLKIPSNYFTGFAGDVLLVDEGTGAVVPSLFIVHWDGGQFVVRQIVTGTSSLEHVVFAPINIPALP